jgi:hypothetical protein
MLKALVNGIKCVIFYDERVFQESAPYGFPFMYHIRQMKMIGLVAISIEKYVAVNLFRNRLHRKTIRIW